MNDTPRSNSWNRFWFAAESVEQVAAFRILLGSFLVVYFVTFLPNVTLMFSNEGVYFPWLLPDYGPPPWLAWLIYLATLCAMLAFTLGYRTAISTPLTLLGFLHHYFLQMAVKHSTFERLIIEWLIVMCFVESDRLWSLSAPRAVRAADVVDDDARADQAQPSVAAWAGRIVRFQTVMLYLGAGLWKAGNPHWRSGALLHATLQGVWSTDVGFLLVRSIDTEAGWALLSQLVIVGEIVLGVLFCFRRTRALAILGGIAFHLGNVVFLAIPEFVVCLAPYVFFVEPGTLRAAVKRMGLDRLSGSVAQTVGGGSNR